ncbi:MAG: hypothetical protein F6K10_37360 [Moorea sp. SIO2B7]|nr:hypothetical protein [Moorena sp. SIO2B7]
MNCFGWEAYYSIGSGSKKEYEKMRKKRHSYLDTYKLLNFIDEIDACIGLTRSVKRME